MAVVATQNPTGLKIKYNCGANAETGKIVYKTKTYTNVSPDASDQDIFDVGNLLASLQKNTVQQISRIDDTSLSA